MDTMPCRRAPASAGTVFRDREEPESYPGFAANSRSAVSFPHVVSTHAADLAKAGERWRWPLLQGFRKASGATCRKRRPPAFVPLRVDIGFSVRYKNCNKRSRRESIVRAQSLIFSQPDVILGFSYNRGDFTRQAKRVLY
ncbi:hypothetical protein [Aquamicrobium sp.]|uniref:hypothetical protein n=1 Tax=Aquamicrobium sp. TaxID=1872579 RepID=UPI002583194A|nr:hypothetical protein [Aquamicrobium sp.]MCK9550374.1 hypothetical protein [Aquamicrobium sp.]